MAAQRSTNAPCLLSTDVDHTAARRAAFAADRQLAKRLRHPCDGCVPPFHWGHFMVPIRAAFRKIPKPGSRSFWGPPPAILVQSAQGAAGGADRPAGAHVPIASAPGCRSAAPRSHPGPGPAAGGARYGPLLAGVLELGGTALGHRVRRGGYRGGCVAERSPAGAAGARGPAYSHHCQALARVSLTCPYCSLDDAGLCSVPHRREMSGSGLSAVARLCGR